MDSTSASARSLPSSLGFSARSGEEDGMSERDPFAEAAAGAASARVSSEADLQATQQPMMQQSQSARDSDEQQRREEESKQAEPTPAAGALSERTPLRPTSAAVRRSPSPSSVAAAAASQSNLQPPVVQEEAGRNDGYFSHRAAGDDEQSADPIPTSPPSRTKPVVVRRAGGSGSKAAASLQSTRTPSSAARSRTAPSATVEAHVLQLQFPSDAFATGLSSPPAKKGSGAGVFKAFFSPGGGSRAGDSQAPVSAVTSPMASFSTPVRAASSGKKRSASSAGSANRIMRAEDRNPFAPNAGSNLSPGSVARRLEPSAGARPRTAGGHGLGRSASAMTLPSSMHGWGGGSQSALGLLNESDEARAQRSAMFEGDDSGEHSFARRMIHSQSAMELGGFDSAPSAREYDEAQSLFFAPERDDPTALIPYHAPSIPANPSNSWPRASPSSPGSRRPRTAGVSASGLAWSEKLTAAIEEQSREAASLQRKPGPRPRTTQTGRTPVADKKPATLPPELSIAVDILPATLQREHAALARLIRGLEPAGKASLSGVSVFGSLSSAARGALLGGSRSGSSATATAALGVLDPDPSESPTLKRVEVVSESDAFLRKRSAQKGVENAKQASAALSSRGASMLPGNNLSAADVARAVARTASEYEVGLSDERPRARRPATAGADVGVAAALAAAGSPSAKELVERIASPNRDRAATASGTRQRRKSASSTRPSTALHRSPSSDHVLLPGGSNSSNNGVSPRSVLGFSGSIERFSDAVGDHRHVGAATSSLGGRGMLASRSAAALLAGVIPTGSDAALGPPVVAQGGKKSFASMALELEVALAERLVRIDAHSASASLQRFDVFRTLFDELIVHSPHFGALLARVKAEYESYIRAGAHTHSGSSDDSTPAASPAVANAQAVEDALVLENHRLHTKLHGFQRAYTSLYAKYKSLLHASKVQEGLLQQSQLVQIDLSAQLKAAVLAGMSEEERRMEALREEGFKLENETAWEAADSAAARAKQRDKAVLPAAIDDEEQDDNADEEDASLSTEERHKRQHERKLARARARAAAQHAKENDPLERGRALMRNYTGPLGSALRAQTAAAAADDGEAQADSQLLRDGAGDLIDPSSGERVLSPQKLVHFLDQDSASSDSATAASAAASRSHPQRRRSPDPNDPAAMLSDESDPLSYLTTHSRRDLAAAQQRARELEDRLREAQSALEQSRARELQARMAMEQISKQRYIEEKTARDRAAEMQQQQHHAVAREMTSRASPEPSTHASRVTSRQASGSRVAADAAEDEAHAMHALPPSVLLDNIDSSSQVRGASSSHSRAASRHSLDLYVDDTHPLHHDAQAFEYADAPFDSQPHDQLDEDPDQLLAPTGSQHVQHEDDYEQQ